MLEIRALPAREGDAIWIRWGSAADPHQLMIDMGTPGSGKKLRDRFVKMPEIQRRLDLLVITHVDADHIGGVLTCLAEADARAGFEVDDVWFNGYIHLSGGKVAQTEGLEPMGPAQGERLSRWLKKQRWNHAFQGKPVWRRQGEPLATIELHDDLRLTVLGPTQSRLSDFVDDWEREVKEAMDKGRLQPEPIASGLEAMGAANAPILTSDAELLALARNREDEFDGGKANGTSIALLLEYKNRKMILAGDAFSPDLVEVIGALSSKTRLNIDVFKLPHHGSRNNVHQALIEAVDCDCWLVSTDGTRFKHPDAEAMARIIRFSKKPRPQICFNVPSTYNGWWKRESWTKRFNYQVEYGTAEDGWSCVFDD